MSMSEERQFEKIRQLSLQREKVVQKLYGENVLHINNFPLHIKEEILALYTDIPSIFKAEALIGDGNQRNESNFGLYTTNNDDRLRFWRRYNDSGIDY